jgi:hypothetical protein
MADGKTSRDSVQRVLNRPGVRLPGLGRITLPDRTGLLWYAGVGAMAAAEIVEWPIAALVVGTHFIENNSHNRDIQELAEGITAGA